MLLSGAAALQWDPAMLTPLGHAQPCSVCWQVLCNHCLHPASRCTSAELPLHKPSHQHLLWSCRAPSRDHVHQPTLPLLQRWHRCFPLAQMPRKMTFLN